MNKIIHEMSRRALIVGINAYPDMPLTGCVKDATDLAELLIRNTDDSLNFNVQLRTNVQRRNELKEMIDDLFSGDEEVALLYFSGHGYIDKYGSGYLVMPDHRHYDEGISMNDILILANNSHARHKIIILDCCYSGAIAAPAISHAIMSHINQGVTILTASSHNEVAVEVRGQGMFTGLLLDALRGGAADVLGHITPGSVYAYIDQALGPWEQSPLFKANVSEFVSLRKTAPRVEMQVLRKITDYFKDSGMRYPLDPSYEETNRPGTGYNNKEPYANEAHIAIFKMLQAMCSEGLIEPVDSEHMYWAAMNSTGCRLTPLGAHYRRLVERELI